VGPRAILDAVVKRKIPSPRRESNPSTPTVQPVSQRYTDRAITALRIHYVTILNAHYTELKQWLNIPHNIKRKIRPPFQLNNELISNLRKRNTLLEEFTFVQLGDKLSALWNQRAYYRFHESPGLYLKAAGCINILQTRHIPLRSDLNSSSTVCF
jgi:hypothetical protein